MPNEQFPTIKPFGGFRFLNNKSFSEALPFIRKAECAIISAEQAGYTFKESAERTEALRLRFSDPFTRGRRSFVFDCQLIDSRGMQPRDRLVRYLFIAVQPAFEGDPLESSFLERLVKLNGAFSKGLLIFMPFAKSDEARPAMSVVRRSKEDGSIKLENLGALDFNAEAAQVEIAGPDKQLIFEVTGSAPIVQPSMNTAYLFRTLKHRGYRNAHS